MILKWGIPFSRGSSGNTGVTSFFESFRLKNTNNTPYMPTYRSIVYDDYQTCLQP